MILIDLAAGKSVKLLRFCLAHSWTPHSMNLSVYYHCPSAAFRQLLGVTIWVISSQPYPTFHRFLRSRRYSFGENCHATTPSFCSSSWTTPRPTFFSRCHLRPPPTPSFTIARAFPFAASSLMVSFDLALGKVMATTIQNIFPAWASTAVAATRVTVITRTIESILTSHID